MTTLAFDLEIEQRVLGGCLKSVDWLEEVMPNLWVHYFFCPKNQAIFVLIQELYESGLPVTLSNLSEKIGSRNDLMERAIDIYQIGSLAFLPSEFVYVLKNHSLKRLHEEAANIFLNRIRKKETQFEEAIKDFDSDISSISKKYSKNTLLTPKEILDVPKPFLKVVEEKQILFKEGKIAYSGIPTEYYELDKHIRGLTEGHLTIIGARPGMGKTSFALNLLEKMVLKNIPSIFFSLEMPAKELLEKLICQMSEVSFEKFANGNLNSQEFHKLIPIHRLLTEKNNVIIDEQPSLSIDQIKSRSVRAKKTDNIQVVFVDYVQLVISNKKGTDVRHLEIADISRRLKELAKELKVSVIALAQLNRDVEKREKKNPYLSDLRESGSLEADADEVILLHRPDMYDKNEKPGLMQVSIAKNRFGPTGDFYLVFQKEFGALKNYDFKNSRPQVMDNSVSKRRDPWEYFDKNE